MTNGAQRSDGPDLMSIHIYYNIIRNKESTNCKYLLLMRILVFYFDNLYIFVSIKIYWFDKV